MGGVVSSAMSAGLEQSSLNRLPPLEGELSLPILDAPATIRYDRWGIPHVTTKTNLDVFRMQGFIQAQHRGFQLQTTKMAVHGRLCELVGANAKRVDAFVRTLGWGRLAANDWEVLQSNRTKYGETIDMMKAYCEGINAWISHPKYERPVELAKLILDSQPEFWTPVDVLGVCRFMGFKMGLGWQVKWLNTLLIQAVGYENAKWFAWDQENNPHVPYMDIPPNLIKKEGKDDESDVKSSVDSDKPSVHEFYEKLPSVLEMFKEDESEIKLESGAASNGWIVSGKLTDTGKPLLAGDPHLPLTVPNIFLHIHCRSEEGLHFSGLQAAGVPALIFGHTEKIGLTITLSMIDYCDVFVERFKKDEPDSLDYEVDGEWVKAKVRKEIIKIKNEDDWVLNIVQTKHGNILTPTDFEAGSEKGPYAHLVGSESEEKLDNSPYDLRYALASTTALPGNNLLPYGLLQMVKSSNVTEVRGWLRECIPYPSLNITMGDIHGNIGYVCTGIIPIKGNQDSFQDALPIPGWLSKYDWKGFIPKDAMPTQINPKQEYIVSCNHRVVDPDKYPFHLGYNFASGYRAQRAINRIRDRVESKEEPNKIDIDYMIGGQLDTQDLCAEQTLKVLKKMDLDKVLDEIEIRSDDIPAYKGYWQTEKFVAPDYNTTAERDKAKLAWRYIKAYDGNLNIESETAPFYQCFKYCFMRTFISAGIYTSLSNRYKDKTDTIDINAQTLELTEKLCADVYSPAILGAHAFKYKIDRTILHMLERTESEDDKCWWLENLGGRLSAITVALSDTVTLLTYWLGEDTSHWKYGDFHQVMVPHPLSVKLGPQPFNRGPFPAPGSTHTLCMMRNTLTYAEKKPFGNTNNMSVWRMVVDFSDLSKSVCVLPMGTSGQLSSLFYDNMMETYMKGEYIPMVWTEEQIEEYKQYELELSPEKPLVAEDDACVLL